MQTLDQTVFWANHPDTDYMAAWQKAAALLDECLSPQQREDYRLHKWFFVTGSSGARYRIRHGCSGNIDLISRSGRIVESLCGLPYISLPTEDVLLAQKLSLEANDRAFRRIARHGLPLHTNERLLPALPHKWRDFIPRYQPFASGSGIRLNVLVGIMNTASAAAQLYRGHPVLAAITGLSAMISYGAALYFDRLRRPRVTVRTYVAPSPS